MSLPGSDQKPNLEVTPTFLDFGVFNSDDPLTDQPAIQVEVSNTGGKMLIGRVIPQYSWLIVSPVEFHVDPGQTSRHLVRLSTGAPHQIVRREYGFSSLVIVSANGGTVSLGGAYISTPSQDKPSLMPPWGWFMVGFVAFMLSIFFLFKDMINGSAVKTPNTSGVEALYTQGAATVMAKLTQKVDQHAEVISTPLPPLFLATRPFETATQVITPTYTPWPRTKYNPEQFIRDYYGTINSQDYQHAWGMLSKNFQDSCCKIGGNDPFVVYSGWWTEIAKTEVVSAYLQAWDVNPAQVFVKVHYTYKSGKTGDLLQVYTLISDSDLNTLLIDKVK
jgi:hypothetical protein